MSSFSTVSSYSDYIDLQNYTGSAAPAMSGSIWLSGTAGNPLVYTNVGINVAGPLTGDTSLTLDSTTLTTAELGVLDGVTAGTSAASKAMVTDASGDILMPDGDKFELGASSDMQLYHDGTNSYIANKTGALKIATETSGIAITLGHTTSEVTIADNLNTTGRVLVNDTTDATSTTDGSLQTDGGLSVAKDAVFGDDVKLLSDAAVLSFGADSDVTLTHVADTGVLLNSDHQLQFRDSTEYINSDADGYLNVRAATEVDLNIGGTDVAKVTSAGLNVVGTITGDTSLTLDTTTITTAEIGVLDGVTAGTATASKAVVLDANRNIGTINQLTASYAYIGELDVDVINSVSKTEEILEVVDKLIIAASGSNASNSDGGGLQIGGIRASDTVASIKYDNGNSALDFNIGGTTEIRLQDGVLRPETDNDVDLGASGGEFKDLWLDGTANIDMLKLPTVTSGHILVADGTSFEEVAVSGDVTMASNGAVTIANGAVETAMIADDAITGAKIALFDDSLAATTTHFLIADGTDYSSFALSGDVTCTNAGVVTIANDAVEQAMIGDDAVGADQLAANAVVNASVADGTIKADKLDIDGSTDINDALVDADLIIVDDGAGGTNRKAAMSRVLTYIESNLDTFSTNVSFSDNNLTNVGVIEADTIQSDADGTGLNINFDGNTGTNKISMQAGQSEALTIERGGTDYLVFNTDHQYIAAKKEIAGENGISVGSSSWFRIGDDSSNSKCGLSFAVNSDDEEQLVISGSSGGTAMSGALDVHGGLIVDGNTEFDGNVTLGEASSKTVTFTGRVASHVLPNADGTRNLGSSALQWGDLYVNGSAYIDALGEALDANSQNISNVGTLTVGGAATFTGDVTLGNASSDEIDIDGTTSFNAPVSVGENDTGHDVTFYGATSGDYFLWDEDKDGIRLEGSIAIGKALAANNSGRYAIDVLDGTSAANKVRAAAFVTYSDERLKGDIKPMRNALKTVNSLNAVNFTWKKGGTKDFGFLAQDLKKIIPQAVHGAEDGLYGVDYGRLTSVLVAAIQEQSAQIAELKAKIENK